MRKNCRGQSLVEFAMVMPLFALLVCGIIDFGNLFFTQMTLQHAMREAGRFGVTGQKLPDPSDPSQNLNRINSIKQIVKRVAAGLNVDPTKVSVTSVNGGNGSAGGPGDTFTISLAYDLPLYTPMIGRFFNNGVYHFTVSTTFKNEPFKKSQTT